MRIWSIHPEYLDAKGLVALWREALLAQAVLAGNTRGYRQHPQLLRFQQKRDPVAAIATYLWGVYRESQRRGYRFDSSRILRRAGRHRLRLTHGQMEFELGHLKAKLKLRDPESYQQISTLTQVGLHPMFDLVDGDVEDWERG
jgi:hypothetical protein